MISIGICGGEIRSTAGTQRAGAIARPCFDPFGSGHGRDEEAVAARVIGPAEGMGFLMHKPAAAVQFSAARSRASEADSSGLVYESGPRRHHYWISACRPEGNSPTVSHATGIEADAVIAVSQGTREDILRAYPDIDPARIHVIYNGIDLAEYRKAKAQDALVKYGVDPALPYVLFVGRITRQKGVTHLVDAIQYMPEGTQVVLCAGAPDTPEIADEMRAKVEVARQRNPRVVWIEKMVTKPEAIELYSHCRVFCCPSVYEPFGIINLEAMACEAPVVASATGGIKEVVVDGKTGYLVPFEPSPITGFPLDPQRFARDLGARTTELLNDPARCREFGLAGRRRVEDIFSWSAIAEQTVELYRKLVAREA